MKKFWSVLAIVFVLSPIGVVSADTVSVSQVIHIQGIVPPMRNIIVDGSGNITEITSNTLDNVTPKVYLGSFTGPELPLTTAMLNDFKAKTKGIDMHSTELHFAAPNQTVSKTGKSGLWKILSWVSYLRYLR